MGRVSQTALCQLSPASFCSTRAQTVTNCGKVSSQKLMSDGPELPVVQTQTDREQNHLESLGKASARNVLTGQERLLIPLQEES